MCTPITRSAPAADQACVAARWHATGWAGPGPGSRPLAGAPPPRATAVGWLRSAGAPKGQTARCRGCPGWSKLPHPVGRRMPLPYELSWPRTLRDVTRQHHHIRRLLRCQCDQCFDHVRLVGTEVRIENLQQRTHGAASGASADPASPVAWSRYKGLSRTRMSMGACMRATSPSHATTTSLRPGASVGLTTM